MGHLMGTDVLYSADIYLEDAGKNIIVEDNVMYDSRYGISIGNEGYGNTDRVIVRRNVSYNNAVNNFTVGGDPFDTNCVSVDGANDVAMVHNTAFTDTITNANSAFSCGSRNRWKNNLFARPAGSSSSQQYQVQPISVIDPATWQLDYNLFHAGTPPNSFQWPGGVSYNSLAAFQSATGFETHSIEDNPLFVDPTTSRDFHLQAGSPAIDAGGSLTNTTSAGSGTVVPVADYRYFTDGFGLEAGDLIRVGANAAARVMQVNETANTLTVDRALSWNTNDPVSYDYAGNAPDIGAFESGTTVPSFDFSLPTPSDITLTQGQSGSNTITANLLSGPA